MQRQLSKSIRNDVNFEQICFKVEDPEDARDISRRIEPDIIFLTLIIG